MNRAQMRRFGKQPFAWNEKKTSDGNHTSDDSNNQNDIDSQNIKHDKNNTSDGDSPLQTCRNSVQGRVLIADDQGRKKICSVNYLVLLLKLTAHFVF